MNIKSFSEHTFFGVSLKKVYFEFMNRNLYTLNLMYIMYMMMYKNKDEN